MGTAIHARNFEQLPTLSKLLVALKDVPSDFDHNEKKTTLLCFVDQRVSRHGAWVLALS